jgi:carboxylesterase type B
LRKQPWNSTLKAFNDPPMCIQRDPFRRDIEIDGNEDCLYLNVYSPEVVEKPLPVMVFFHGGGFMVIKTFSRLIKNRNGK